MLIIDIDENVKAFFNPETLRIWTFPADQWNLFEQTEPGNLSEEAVAAQLGQPRNDPVLNQPGTLDAPDTFDTLILHVTHNCNMACKYCYERNNHYMADPGMMSEQTALRAVELFYSRYSYIREIKFFGGEPTLNQPVIKSVCMYVDRLYASGKIKDKPVYKLLTNGTIMNDNLIDLIRTYGIKVVFSIDGTEKLHDSLRVFPNDAGSYSVMKRNFFLLRSRTDGKQPYSLNVTYTELHKKAGLSMHDLVVRLSDEYGIKPGKVNIYPVETSPDQPFYLDTSQVMLQSARDALTCAIEGDSRTHMKLRAVIRRLEKGGLPNVMICSGAVDWAAVSYRGDVYPCMMFLDRKEYFMGNVKENIFQTESYKKVRVLFDRGYKKEDVHCMGCIARNVCTYCAGMNEYETGEIYPRNESDCREFREIVKTAVTGIALGVW